MAILQFEKRNTDSDKIHEAIEKFLLSPSFPNYGMVIDSMRNHSFLVPYIALKKVNNLNYVSAADVGGGPDTIRTEQDEIALPIFCMDRESEIKNSNILQYNMILEMTFEQIFSIAKNARDKLDLIILNPFSDNFPIIQSVYDNIETGNWEESSE